MDTTRRGLMHVLGGALALTVLAAGCTGRAAVTPSPTAPPSARPAANTSPAQTARPLRSGPAPKHIGCDAIVAGKPPTYPDPTLPPPPSPAISGGDAVAEQAITRALEALTGLSSYRFTVEVIGRELPTLQASTFDLAVKGKVDHSDGLAVDAVMGTRMREADGSAAITSGGQQIKAGGGYVWGTDNVSGDLEPMRDPAIEETLRLLTPEGSAERYVLPFATGYRRIGAERHAGIATQHYQASRKGEAAYARTMDFEGPLTADVWIAGDGDYLVGARVTGKASHVDPTTKNKVDDSFVLAFEVTNPNDPANTVTLPVPPVSDPPRPGHAPVDLMLTYDIAPAGGRMPTAADLDQIGVTLRTRLDVYDRPIKVDFIGLTQVVVTICGTTTPDADRRLASSRGALTLVPLPRDRYGSSSAPGPSPLPLVGSKIDATLPPIAPAARAGLTTAHVDPTTGKRGLAFYPENKTADAFRTYAANHRDEFVAVVLDGIVLATLPIDDRTAKAAFVFTGDYTEAESRNMASWLYKDPIPFELQLIEDVEVPAST
jgi:hypothetical protein